MAAFTSKPPIHLYFNSKANISLCRKHVVFGHVKSGEELVKQLENVKVDANSKPFTEISIAKSGELVLQVKSKGEPIVYIVGTGWYVFVCVLWDTYGVLHNM